MGKQIVIEPITRIEGHGEVNISLNKDGKVSQAKFKVNEFRGFEKFCQGRMFWEMPVITTRICGICPVSHHLASAKAGDDLLGVDIPEIAKKLRELMMVASYFEDHALHFFILASPDFVIGPKSNPSRRNVVGIVKTNPDLALKAIRLRQIGQNIVKVVGGRAIHPVSAIPGGMSKPLSASDYYQLNYEIDEALNLAEEALEVGKVVIKKYKSLIETLAIEPTMHLGTVDEKGNLALYDGRIRLIDTKGKKVEEFEPKDYLDYLGEKTKNWTYLKFPYYLKAGFPQGIYRVGPLARLNVANSISTPRAAAELEEFKAISMGKPIQPTLYYHYARLIELLYATERAKELLGDKSLINEEVRVKVDRKGGEGIGAVEAPRGLLIHHYRADDMGALNKVNLIVATQNNNQAINQNVLEVAKKTLSGNKVTEGLCNQIEMSVRAYDPCLSCATHQLNKPLFKIQLYDAHGKCIDSIGG